MWKQLKIVISSIQAVIAITVFAIPKLTHSTHIVMDALSLQKLVVKLNFPLVIVWSPVLYAADRTSGSFAWLSGSLFIAVSLLIGAVFASSVAAFWYFLVSEIEMRTRGESMLRVNNWPAELAVATVLLCFGAGTGFYAYGSIKSLIYVRPFEAIVGGSFLIIWAAIFIAACVSDVASITSKRRLDYR